MGSVTRAEWRWAAAFAVVASLLLALPYLVADSAQGAEWRFSGFLFGVEDGNSYIADMRQGAQGAWLFRIPYTSEPQRGALMYLPYLLLGKLAGGGALHDQLVALFHLARFAAAAAMLLAIYRFLACFVEDVALRRWGLVAAAFGGGFGWILLARGSYPLEFTSPEAFGFLSLFGIPHLAAARALLLLALAWYLAPAPAEGSQRQGAKVGLALAGAWFFQPLVVTVAWAVMGAHLALILIRNLVRRIPPATSLREGWARAWIAGLITAPPVLYSAVSFAVDPVLRQWAAQNTLPSPPLGEYLLSYSVALLPALAGAWLAWREDGRRLLPVGWMAAVPILIYLPVTVQRRLVDGFWTALIVLALFFVEKKLSGWRRRAAFVFGTAFLLPAAALFWSWSLMRSFAPSTPAFLPAAEVRAMEWLDAEAEPGAVVLAGFDAGNALPAYSGLLSYIGHGPETLNGGEKRLLVETVLDGTRSEGERLSALRQTGAQYVLVGPAEAAGLGAGIPGCELIYRQGGWEVWRVVH
jgi:hypothetical protein